MTKFEQEFQELKPYDEVQFQEIDEKTGFPFITTAGHGYLVVPHESFYSILARNVATNYGYIGKLATYLEEDCEYAEFAKKFLRIKSLPTIETV